MSGAHSIEPPLKSPKKLRETGGRVKNTLNCPKSYQIQFGTQKVFSGHRPKLSLAWDAPPMFLGHLPRLSLAWDAPPMFLGHRPTLSLAWDAPPCFRGTASGSLLSGRPPPMDLGHRPGLSLAWEAALH